MYNGAMYNSTVSLGALVSCSQTAICSDQSFGRAESEIKCQSGYSRLQIGCYVYNGDSAYVKSCHVSLADCEISDDLLGDCCRETGDDWDLANLNVKSKVSLFKFLCDQSLKGTVLR